MSERETTDRFLAADLSGPEECLAEYEILDRRYSELADAHRRLQAENERLTAMLQSLAECREGKWYTLPDVMNELKTGEKAKTYAEVVAARDAAVANCERLRWWVAELWRHMPNGVVMHANQRAELDAILAAKGGDA